MINCEIEFILAWSKNRVLTDMTARTAGSNNDPPAIVATTELEFQNKDAILYVPVVALPKQNDKNFLEQLKSGFKRKIKWNKHRSRMTIQSNNYNLNYLIDPTLTNVNRLFVLSFKRCEEKNIKKGHRDSISHYYIANVEMKISMF